MKVLAVKRKSEWELHEEELEYAEIFPKLVRCLALIVSVTEQVYPRTY